MRLIHIAGTCDTKAEEIAYLRDLVLQAGHRAVVVDLGTRAPGLLADVPARIPLCQGSCRPH